MRHETVQAINGWGAVFRLVTPALLGVLVWITTSGNAHRDRQMERIDTSLHTLSNDYYHQLSDIKDRLGRIEGRNVVMNGIQQR